MCIIYSHCCCGVLHMWIFKHVLRENQYEKINKNRWTKKKNDNNAGLLLLSLSFSCISSIVSLGMRCSPHHKSYSIVVYCADNSYMSVTQFFLSPLCLYFFILKFRYLFSSVLSCVLFYSLSLFHSSIILFFSIIFSVLSDLFCFLLSVYSVYFLISLVFFSNLLYILSFLFSYYSNLSASPNLLSFLYLFSFPYYYSVCFSLVMCYFSYLLFNLFSFCYSSGPSN